VQTSAPEGASLSVPALALPALVRRWIAVPVAPIAGASARADARAPLAGPSVLSRTAVLRI
jgi:hypothetical protein